MNTHVHASKPWFKEPWPWLLAIMPLTAIVAGGFTVWFAVTSNDGLVVDDYYKQGKAINQTRERDRVAQSLGIRARMDSEGATLRLMLDGQLPTPPGRLTLEVLHPTRSGDDHNIELNWNGSAYVGQAPRLTGSHYRVQLTPEFGDWRLTGALRPGNTVTLNPRM